MKRNENGFTLIELLIVIIILGILAVIGIPKFMNSKQDSIIKACQTNRSSLEDVGERYNFDCAKYPTGQTDLTTDPSITGWNGPYIKAAFSCPAGSSFIYSFATTGVVSCNAYDATGKAATGGHAKTD